MVQIRRGFTIVLTLGALAAAIAGCSAVPPNDVGTPPVGQVATGDAATLGHSGGFAVQDCYLHMPKGTN